MRYIVDIKKDTGVGGIVVMLVIIAVIIGSCGGSKASNSQTKSENANYTAENNDETSNCNETEYDYNSNEYLVHDTINEDSNIGDADNQVENLPKPLINCYRVVRSHPLGVSEGDAQDSFGTKHSNCIYVTCCSTDIYSVTYNLDRMYTLLTCQFMHGNGIYEGYGRVSVYLDDVLTYTSPNIDITTEPIYANIDVTGVKLVRIEVVSPEIKGTEVGQTIIDASVS